MSTPPSPPNDTLELLPPPRRRSILAKLAIAFAVILSVTFGLCTVVSVSGLNDSISVFWAFYTIEAACLAGLLIIAVIVVIRALLPAKR
jgi:hypothetical protein